MTRVGKEFAAAPPPPPLLITEKDPNVAMDLSERVLVPPTAGWRAYYLTHYARRAVFETGSGRSVCSSLCLPALSCLRSPASGTRRPLCCSSSPSARWAQHWSSHSSNTRNQDTVTRWNGYTGCPLCCFPCCSCDPRVLSNAGAAPARSYASSRLDCACAARKGVMIGSASEEALWLLPDGVRAGRTSWTTDGWVVLQILGQHLGCDLMPATVPVPFVTEFDRRQRFAATL